MSCRFLNDLNKSSSQGHFYSLLIFLASQTDQFEKSPMLKIQQTFWEAEEVNA